MSDECYRLLESVNISEDMPFRKWALKNSPDKGGDVSRFQEVSRCNDMIYKNPMFSTSLPEMKQVLAIEDVKKETPVFSSSFFERPSFQFPSFNCPPGKTYRRGYVNRYGTEVGETCASPSRRRKSRSRRRKSVSRRVKRCSSGKSRRRGYYSRSGKRVKSICARKPLKCSPRKTRRRSYTRKNGTKVRSSCVRRRR